MGTAVAVPFLSTFCCDFPGGSVMNEMIPRKSLCRILFLVAAIDLTGDFRTMGF
jgi:hypothetical protein